MAHLTEFLPFLLKCEAGVICSPYDVPSAFGLARKSGWSDDPNDHGGKTMVGVTWRTWLTYCGLVGRTPTVSGFRNMDFGTWQTIVRRLFWNQWKADLIDSQSVAEMLVDWYWGSGKVGITRPQRILRVKPDGIVGPKTIAAVNAQNPNVFFEYLKLKRNQHFKEIVEKDPTQARFLGGWLNRLNSHVFKG